MNETPENPQPTTPPPAGDHGFGPVTSSEPAPAPAEPTPAPAPASAPAEPAPAAPAPAEPVAPDAAPAFGAAAPQEPQAPAVQAYPPAPDAAAQPYPVPGAGYAADAAPQPYVDAAGQPYVDPAGQPYAVQGGYPGAPGQAPSAFPAGVYDPNAPVYDPNLPGGVPPYGGYPGAAPAPKKGLSKGALFGIIGGVLALILIIAAAIIVPALLRGPQLTASDVVEEYLTAVADGDAETALQYVDPYGDDSLLTDEVLAASAALAPIEDIEVGEVSGSDYDSTVPVTFSIGGADVSRDFQVYHYDDEWQIVDGLISLSGFYGFEGLEPTVNGVAAPESAYVFPGTYEVALGVEEFAIEGDTTTFQVASDADAEALWDLRPVLTEDGTATFRELVSAAVEECVAMKTLTTPCGMDLTDIDLSGYTPVDGTVTRTLTAEGKSTLESLAPEVTQGSVVTTYDSIDVDMTLQGEKGGEKAEFEVWFGGYLNSPKVDFAAETPEVVWE